jgi:hypothetical protein
MMKTWKDMSPEEKGALLLAHHEGKVIEWKPLENKLWHVFRQRGPLHWDDCYCYRVKPEPVVEEVVMFTKIPSSYWGWTADGCAVDRTHKITFNTVDGEPDCSSIKMEKLK